MIHKEYIKNQKAKCLDLFDPIVQRRIVNTVGYIGAATLLTKGLVRLFSQNNAHFLKMLMKRHLIVMLIVGGVILGST